MSDYLTKSMLMTYRTCPRLYYYNYVERIPQKTSPEMERGVLVHKYIEHHNKNQEIEKGKVLSEIIELNHLEHVENFLSFHAINLQDNISTIVAEEKYYFPDKGVKGIVDVVYTDGVRNLLLDYKTGQFRDYKIPEYRIELSFYKYLLELAGHPVAYWGMFFTKDAHLWREKINDKDYQKGLEVMEKTKKLIAENKFDKKFSMICNGCQFRNVCWK